MSDAYDPQSIEKKWQERWEVDGTYQVDNDDPRPPFYVLCMYPYPSGPAHMGHVRNYTFGDLIVRHRTSGWVSEIARKDEDALIEAHFDPESGVVTVYEGRPEFKALERLWYLGLAMLAFAYYYGRKLTEGRPGRALETVRDSEVAAAVMGVTTSGRGTELVVGVAGAGKTTALSAMREAFDKSAIDIVTIATPKLGALVNRVKHCGDVAHGHHGLDFQRGERLNTPANDIA